MANSDRQPLFMTVKEAAYQAQISPHFIWRSIAQKRGPIVRRFGRNIRIHRQDFEEWTKSRIPSVHSAPKRKANV